MTANARRKGKIDIVMLMLVMLLVATAFLIVQFWRLLELSQRHNHNEVELISLSHNVLHDNSFLIKTLRMYVLSREDEHKNEYLNKLNDSASFYGRLNRMKEIGLTESENEKVSRIKDIWGELEKIEDDALKAMDAQDHDKALSIVYGDEYARTDSLLVDIFQSLTSEVELRGRTTTDAINKRILFAMVLFSAAFLVILTVLALTFRNNNKLREHAERSSRYKSAFLANMSHEIRTPMNAILGITEIQLRDGNLPKEMEDALNEVYNSGSLLLNIINDILDLSKIEAGKLEIVPVRYDLPSLINDAVQITCLRYDSKSIEFTLDVDENAPLNLWGDVLRLKQILNNVLSNAFKYTDSGEVKMSVSSETKRGGDGAADDGDVTLVFRVSDTGQGMTAEQLKKIFDEYTRFNMEANRATVGTGLGMSITKRLVDLMGGTIDVESVYGEGSAFTVRVPQKRVDSLVCGKETADKLASFRFQSAGVSNKIRMLREYMPYGSVLVVDDVKSNIFVAKGLLIPYGLKVDTASSGKEAIEKIKAGKVYDIIFMDHMMPEMDGVEAVKIIRGMGYTKSIVALTANALVGQAEVFLNNGFDGYISKPVDSRELNLALNDFIRDKQSPEVINAARREQQEWELAGAPPGAKTKTPPEEADCAEKFFVLDAEKTITVLERVSQKPGEIDDAQINAYEIAAHGIKSALKNIGEMSLAEVALTLEEAAKTKNIAVIREETDALVRSLKTIIAKFKEREHANAPDHAELTTEDADFLRAKLTTVKAACEHFDTRTADAELRELTSRAWPKRIRERLDIIGTNLLHSDFEKAESNVSDLLAEENIG